MSNDYRWNRWDMSHPINGVGVTSMGVTRIYGIRRQKSCVNQWKIVNYAVLCENNEQWIYYILTSVSISVCVLGVENSKPGLKPVYRWNLLGATYVQFCAHCVYAVIQVSDCHSPVLCQNGTISRKPWDSGFWRPRLRQLLPGVPLQQGIWWNWWMGRCLVYVHIPKAIQIVCTHLPGGSMCMHVLSA